MIRFILTAIVLLILLILACPLLLVCLILKYIAPKAEEKFIMGLIRWFMWNLYFVSGAKVTYKGVDNIPKDTGVLYIGNHNSYFDIIFTYYMLPGNVGYIAKKELEKVPIISWAMKLSYCLFLDRDNMKQGLAVILKAIEYVKKGVGIFIFPEGTRSKDGKMAEFKEGSFKIAQKSGCPIVPVAFSNTADVFEKHIPKIKAANVIIEFLPPIYPKDLDKEESKRIGKIVQNVIEEAVQKNNAELGLQ